MEFEDIPEPIKQHLAEGGDENSMPRLSFSDLPKRMQEYIHVMKEDEYRRHEGDSEIQGHYDE
jgi:hypothetical protein